MKKLLTALIALLLALPVLAQTDTAIYRNFNTFNNEVLKGHVTKREVQKRIGEFMAKINHEYLIRSQIDLDKPEWIFPLQGYTYRAAGGSNGNGYNDKGFRYIDGNKHGAHPAHDIFINDKNQDGIDDKTHQPVNVLAIASGRVIACTNDWDAASDMRGGRYIWLYHPGAKPYFSYYAHNRAIFVRPGQYVTQGQKIAEVGRTGFNAYKKRSPTHLHFSTFILVDNIPVSFNSYKQLKTAITK